VPLRTYSLNDSLTQDADLLFADQNPALVFVVKYCILLSLHTKWSKHWLIQRVLIILDKPFSRWTSSLFEGADWALVRFGVCNVRCRAKTPVDLRRHMNTHSQMKIACEVPDCTFHARFYWEMNLHCHIAHEVCLLTVSENTAFLTHIHTVQLLQLSGLNWVHKFTLLSFCLVLPLLFAYFDKWVILNWIFVSFLVQAKHFIVIVIVFFLVRVWQYCCNGLSGA